MTRCSRWFWVAMAVLSAGLISGRGGVEIWITPAGNGGGSGTCADPFSAPDADSFFNLIHDQRVVNGTNYVIPPASLLHLMPGTFTVRDGKVRGHQRYCLTLKNNWKVRGAGMDVTVLRLQDHVAGPAPGAARRLEMIRGGGDSPGDAADWPVDGAEISDLTVDCNLQNQSNLCVDGVTPAGSRNRVSRVRAINWGTTSTDECFVFSVGSHWRVRPEGYHEGVIEDCVADKPAPIVHKDGTSAFMLSGNGPWEGGKVGTADRDAGGWVLRNCSVRDVTTGRGPGQPHGFHAFGAVGRGCDIVGNFALNVTGKTGGEASAIYCDSFDDQDITIRDNTLMNVNFGISYNYSANNLTNLVIRDNLITVSNGGVGIYLYNVDDPTLSHVMRGVLISGNRVYPHHTGASCEALIMRGAIEAVVQDNLLDGGAPPKGRAAVIPEVYRPKLQVFSFQNNRNLAGQLIQP